VTFSTLYLSALREAVKARRLPYLCPACGTRTNHTRTHYPAHGGVCRAVPIWASDPESA
jgi:hypothetical protein